MDLSIISRRFPLKSWWISCKWSTGRDQSFPRYQWSHGTGHLFNIRIARNRLISSDFCPTLPTCGKGFVGKSNMRNQMKLQHAADFFLTTLLLFLFTDFNDDAPSEMLSEASSLEVAISLAASAGFSMTESLRFKPVSLISVPGQRPVTSRQKFISKFLILSFQTKVSRGENLERISITV